MTIGQRIRAARQKAGITQADLGKILSVSGSMIAQYETNKRNPKYDTLKRIAAALNVNVNWLINGQTLEQRNQGMKDYVAQRFKEAESALVDGSIRIHISPEQREYSQLSQKLNDETLTEAELQRLAELRKNLPTIQESIIKLNGIMNRLGQCLITLNEEGQQKVEDYAQDLTKIPEYRRQDAPEPPLSST